MGAALTFDHAAAARLRGEWPRALECAHRAVPAAVRQRQHAPRELHDAGAVFPPAAQSRTTERSTSTDRVHPEEPVAPQGVNVDDGRPEHWTVPAGDRRSDGTISSRRGAHAAPLLRPYVLRAEP